MKHLRFWAALLLLAPPLALLNGCGGGGGGGDSGGSPTATPTGGPTPTIGSRVLVVQLRDRANQPVDGVVSIGANPVAGSTILATTGGSATFNRNVPGGTLAVSAEVDGATVTGSVAVKSSGTTFYTLTIAPAVTPVPQTTVPPPPF